MRKETQLRHPCGEGVEDDGYGLQDDEGEEGIRFFGLM
jgi:hypothetical protein